jgi:hypothetical protein
MKHKKSISMKQLTRKTLPAINNGLKQVESTTKTIVKSSIPVFEKGVSAVYGTMSSGLDLGMKGVKSVTKKVSLSRSRARSGGRRRRSRKRSTRRRNHH